MYAGYTYTQQLSEANKLRAGLGLGYEKYKDTTTSEKGTAYTEREAFYTKAHATWLPIWAAAGIWILGQRLRLTWNAKLKHNATTAGASADINAKTRGWGVGVGANIGKQITDTVGIEAGPFYKHRHFKASGDFVLDGENIRVDPTKINEYGVRVGVKF